MKPILSWPFLSVVLMAANMRLGLAGMSPLLSDIQSDIGLSPVAAGLLTGLPLVMFGVGAFLTPGIALRLGLSRSILVASSLIAVGQLLRVWSGASLLFAGTLLFAAGVSFANVLLPSLLKERFSAQQGLSTALYTVALTGSAALAAATTGTVATLLGGDWRIALLMWTAPAILGTLIWAVVWRSAAANAVDALQTPAGRQPMTKAALAVITYAGLQAGTFYAVLAWLPSLVDARGTQSVGGGVLLGATVTIGLPLAVIAPIAANKMRVPGITAGVVSLIAALGLVLTFSAANSWSWIGAALLGAGQAAAFPLSILFVQIRTTNALETAKLGALAQGFGYLLASFLPAATGTLFGLKSQWQFPTILVTTLLIVQSLAGVLAGRRHPVWNRDHAPTPNAPS